MIYWCTSEHFLNYISHVTVVTVHSVPVTGKIHAKFASQMDFCFLSCIFSREMRSLAHSWPVTLTYFDRQKHRGCCEIWRFHNIWLRCLEFPYHILCICTISQQTLRPYIPTEGIIYLSIRFFPMSDKFNFQSSLLMSQSPSCFPILPGFHA